MTFLSHSVEIDDICSVWSRIQACDSQNPESSLMIHFTLSLIRVSLSVISPFNTKCNSNPIKERKMFSLSLRRGLLRRTWDLKWEMNCSERAFAATVVHLWSFDYWQSIEHHNGALSTFLLIANVNNIGRADSSNQAEIKAREIRFANQKARLIRESTNIC